MCMGCSGGEQKRAAKPARLTLEGGVNGGVVEQCGIALQC